MSPACNFKRMIRFLPALLMISFILPAGFPAAPAAEGDLPLCVMSFNLRYASSQPPNSWSERRPVMSACIRHLAPDILGTQEGLYEQLKDLASDLAEYSWIGLGREGGSRGEFMAVFYRRDRFEPLAFDHFWLSDTPEVIGSSTWGNSNRRMVTWVRFKERTSGREFIFLNTHFDHQIEIARQKSASLVVERVRKMQAGLPIVLTGDFNSPAGTGKAYEVLTGEGGFADTWKLAGRRVNEKLSTFHGYKQPVESGIRIDWILALGNVGVEKAEIITFSEHGQFPSDHFPIAAWLKFAAGK
jgi:endonuclease/exonuclease/phosphatase family metal-dependent hydrolase